VNKPKDQNPKPKIPSPKIQKKGKLLPWNLKFEA
jgi:hypothetical protein